MARTLRVPALSSRTITICFAKVRSYRLFPNAHFFDVMWVTRLQDASTNGFGLSTAFKFRWVRIIFEGYNRMIIALMLCYLMSDIVNLSMCFLYIVVVVVIYESSCTISSVLKDSQQLSTFSYTNGSCELFIHTCIVVISLSLSM